MRYPYRSKHAWGPVNILLTISLLIKGALNDVISLNGANIGSVIGSNEVVFINFYADWCRFSQILAPVFEEASNKVKDEFPTPGKIAFGKVDCDSESDIASQYHISKYPTLKLVRNGQLIKKEYRGQRSVDALVQFVKDQVRDSVQQIDSLDKLDELNEKKRHIIGYFADVNSDSYRLFNKVASTLREDCEFHSAVGPVSEPERSMGDRVVYRAPQTTHQDIAYIGSLTDFDGLLHWAQQNCVPLVREITFDNAEELTEEGLPFLILFHHPDDKDIVQRFSNVVQQQLKTEKSSVNFLTADGLKFKHPLHHLGKSESDLPVLAIDSFRHMYLFPHDVKKDLETPGFLSQFIADLHSGKLHREFHHGPDPTTPYPTPPPPGSDNAEEKQEQKTDHIPHDVNRDNAPKQPTSPPESTFRKLAPSRNRYTILRDEL
ncbi:endoplasmic reticulum resident protein 44-like [Saccostrea echinata]|uniref:endoplasmic reticulum resident protein 44-like n=1 Tax=Saccostrea echinata TaxID=191078 RepID=UPI002A811F7D|nr:endoplasmic reticulum resident protein 44-like [Saccostrea echinata]